MYRIIIINVLLKVTVHQVGYLPRVYPELYNSYCFATKIMVTRTRLYVTLYIRYLSCYIMLTNSTEKSNYAPGANGQLFKYTIRFCYPDFHLSISLTVSHL